MIHVFFGVLAFLSALPLHAAEPVQPAAAATDSRSHAVLQAGRRLGEKATRHRFEKLRSGAIQTATGWHVQDFASSFFNPNAREIIVAMKMVSDDSHFVFANGQVGIYTKTYKLPPRQGTTDNIFRGSPAFGKPDWPVAARTNFTGWMEFSSSQSFYYYFLPETEVGQAADATAAYFASWKTWRHEVPVAWDDDLQQFVIPYTNYWHNANSWPIGWHSVLTLKNETNQPVTCTLKHIPYYGAQFNPKSGQITHYEEQLIRVILRQQEEKKVCLEKLFGWATDQMSSMEGCLLISPRPEKARTQIKIRLAVIPNSSGKRLHAAMR